MKLLFTSGAVTLIYARGVLVKEVPSPSEDLLL